MILVVVGHEKCHSSASNEPSIKSHIIGAGEVTIHAEVPFVVAHRHTGTLLVKHSAAAKLRKAVLRGCDHVTLEKKNNKKDRWGWLPSGKLS